MSKNKSGLVVLGSTLPNKDGALPVLTLQVQITDPLDVQAIQHDTLAGIDSNPPPGSRVAIIDLGGYKVAISADDNVLKTSLPGEMEIYSSAGGVKMAKVKCTAAGLVDISNNLTTIKLLLTDLFTELKSISTAGSPVAHVVDAATIARLTALEAKFSLLF